MTVPIEGDQVASGPVPKLDDLLARIQQLERRLAEQDRKTLYSASISEGGLIIQDGGFLKTRALNGFTLLFAGPYDPEFNRPDGTPQSGVALYDDNAQARFLIWDPFPLDAEGYQQAIYMYDHLGQKVFTTDVLGGIAEPWFDIPMYALQSMTAGTYGYMSLNAATSERAIWEGRIGYVSHPKLQIDGVWGTSSGSGTHTYRIKIDGVTRSTTAVSTLSVQTLNDIDLAALDYIGEHNVAVQVTVQSSNATSVVATQLLGCAQKQS